MITVDISKCTGCRMCETACSFYHSGEINRHKSRIKVLHHFSSGIDGPLVCCLCKERYCMDCPTDSIQIDSSGELIVSLASCILCKKCETNCPIGAIELFEDVVYVCDLCGGKPRCVETCSEGALVYSPGKGNCISLKDFKHGSEKLNAGEKRTRFIQKLGTPVRTKWEK